MSSHSPAAPQRWRKSSSFMRLLASARSFRVGLDHLHQRLGDLFAMMRLIGRVGEAGEGMVLVPDRVGDLDLVVVNAGRVGIFSRPEREPRAAKGIVLPEGSFRMA